MELNDDPVHKYVCVLSSVCQLLRVLPLILGDGHLCQRLQASKLYHGAQAPGHAIRGIQRPWSTHTGQCLRLNTATDLRVRISLHVAPILDVN